MTIELSHPNDAIMTNPEPGLRRQIMSFTPGMMLVRHKMVKGWVGAKHQHPHEQMVYVVSGRIVLESPAGKVEAAGGDSFIVPGNTDHQAWALEDSEVLDIFTPYREDYAPKV
jgi:quercetin dioxygenase-like cupin family protein